MIRQQFFRSGECEIDLSLLLFPGQPWPGVQVLVSVASFDQTYPFKNIFQWIEPCQKKKKTPKNLNKDNKNSEEASI